ncbi:hypothetical protein [Salinibacter altiplanensis]|uniref:hypothetical protein n=1 Tax=Salinibacter altiplanensis TaxID=1803181 RepID=UPI001F1F4942|nr:hypothetical protein [Salinibacter altiplanensis]
MSNGQRIAVLLVVGLGLLGPTTASAQEAVVGVWSSTLKVKGMEVRLVFHVEQVEKVTSPWVRFFVRYDPAPTLRQVDVPVLALYGSTDLQVPPEQNVDPMREALRTRPSDDVTVRVLDGLNHLFQPAETGLPTQYAQIDTTMVPGALQAVSSWIQERTAAE